MRKTSLEGELSRLNECNNNLLKKVKELQEKLTNAENISSPTPIPKPRPEMLEGEVQHIQEKLISVEWERNELHTMWGESRKKFESILSDYNVCMQRLKTAQKEVANWLSLHQKAVNELDQQQERVSFLEE